MMLRLLRLGCLVLLFGALATPGAARQGDPSITLGLREVAYPGSEWEHHLSPESAGYSTTDLERVRAHLATMHSTGLMAVVGGKVVFQYGDVDTVSYLASVRKSVLSMLYGIQVHRGVIDLDRTLAELGIEDNQGLSDREKQATVRHVLTARSGIYHPASNSGDDLASAPPRGSQPPGSYYLYSNWDFNVLGTIFEQFVGENLYDVLQRDLVEPIGMQDFRREVHRRTGNAQVSRHLAYHMHFSTRDMARIGYLMLRRGNWNGRQVVPAEWVRESTSPITPVHEMNPERRRAGPWGYGYLWWVWDGPDTPPEYQGAYVGLGAVGQHIAVLPALDLVVVHKTVPGQGRAVNHNQFREVLQMIVEARGR
jgi:CubicO group peptidase (beta-lactamase class C family)